MSNPPAALNKRDELSGCNPGEDTVQPDQRLAADRAILTLTKRKEVFFHFEIGFKRTSRPKDYGRAAGVQAPQIEQAVPQPVLAFSAGAPRQPAPAPDGGVAAQDATGGSGSSTSGGAVYVLLKGGTTVTPPDGYPPPP